MGRSRSRREYNVNKCPVNVYGVDRINLAYERVEERPLRVQRGFGFRESSGMSLLAQRLLAPLRDIVRVVREMKNAVMHGRTSTLFISGHIPNVATQM